MLIWQHGCRITNRYCLKLLPSACCRRAVWTAACLWVAVALVLPVAALAQSFTSRELVDVEFAENGALTVLVSAPGARAPGLYRWPHNASVPGKLCALASTASFSFDRRFVIERVRGEPSIVNVFDARRCRRLAHVRVPGSIVVDADVRDRHVAVATRDKDGSRRIRLYNFRGKRLAETQVGVNVEMGFSPDGKSLVNFDLSDKTDTRSGIWTLPRLARTPVPAWAANGETTFVQGARFVKHYSGDSLAVVRWPDGRRLYAVGADHNARLRALSANGRFGLLHQRREQIESLDWIDFATGRRLTVASGRHGGIDHATIDAVGRTAAWTERSGDGDNQVTVRRARIDGGETPAIHPVDPIGTIENTSATRLSRP